MIKNKIPKEEGYYWCKHPDSNWEWHLAKVFKGQDGKLHAESFNTNQKYRWLISGVNIKWSSKVVELT